jgi:predicted glycogen debranching enzyme
MSYLKFEKNQVVNLEYSLAREIIRTNRAGSYSSTTIVGCNTRKYHGLLICPVDEFGGERFVLLSTLDVTVVNNGMSFNTGIIKYKGDHFSPKGHKYIEDFNTDNIPSRIFRVGSVIFKQERLLVHYEEQFLLRITILEAPEPVKFQVRPFMTFRNIHSLTHANMHANTKVEFIENGIKLRLYDGFPYLNMQFSSNVDFVHVPDWYLGVEYPEEQKRGYDFSEDLFTPGFLNLKQKKVILLYFQPQQKKKKPQA